MQYHFDGFRPGDPGTLPAAQDRPLPFPEQADVLIVGAGPAGLTLAAQLSAFPQIVTRIVEQKPGPMERGQADGISCRSMEMFNAFGFAETILKQGYWVNETAFWTPDAADPARIARTGCIRDVEDGLSEMPHMILNQARVHDMYLDVMRRSPSRLVPDYGLQLTALTVEPGQDYPVRVTLERTGGAQAGEAVTLRARHVVGCDGARSAVRRAIGRELSGDSANKAWGVMDLLAVTDFPDIRRKTLIQSAQDGTMMIIPREGGYLFRLYVEMDSLAEGERAAARNISIDRLIAAAQRIFRPYTLDVKEVVWWSVYEISQRIADSFDDLDPDAAARGEVPRVFIAGDACHTHSPKAGQGMNVSMGDGFNLGWKLASVLTGRARPELLASYAAERRGVAQDLIDFDREWARIISARSAAGAGSKLPPFQEAFIRNGRYTAGMSVVYPPSRIIGTDRWQGLATGFPLGARFHSAPVIRLADAKSMHLGHVILADARWRLFAFAPATPDAGDVLDRLCRALAPVIGRFTPPGDPDAVIDLRAVLPQDHRGVTLERPPALLAPRKGRLGLVDHEKIFCADPQADIFDLREIDRTQGCLVLVRPDQHVAQVLPFFDAAEELARFLDGVMLPA